MTKKFLSAKISWSISTRLEILLRPKAPKILQKLLNNSKELLSPRPIKLLKDSKRFQKNPKVSERFQKILLSPRPTKLLKDSKRIQKNLKDSKRFQKNPKDSKPFQKIPKEFKGFGKIPKESKRF